MHSLDNVTWQLPFSKCSRASTFKLFFNARTTHGLFPGKQTRLGISWKDQFEFSNTISVKATATIKLRSHAIEAVTTVEPSFLVNSQDAQKIASNSGILLKSTKENSEQNDREKLRRSRISKANKGNVPWNKGRKHSPGTLQKIRERTRLAMQDPKVKMKLLNIGHAQSDETRAKIGIGVREGWQRRREKLMVQETCYLEWQNKIAEASRKGFNGEEELQWDSYEILDEELKKQFLESVEKRKTMPRPKGSKRAPKSLEQRRKISEAISAKWADPGYRERVCSALAKYHGVPVGTDRKPRKRPDRTRSVEHGRVKKPERENAIFETKIVNKPIPMKKKNVAPMYKDPMANKKLEIIKKIKEKRITMENRKREITERAKLLIAEAEKAAEALEVAAVKSPLARASLLETRKLISEATRSIQSIERGEIAPHDNENSISNGKVASGQTIHFPRGSLVLDTSSEEEKFITQAIQSMENVEQGEIASQDNRSSNLPIQEPIAGHPLSSPEGFVGNMLPVVEKVNGKHQLSSSERNMDNFDVPTLQNAVNGSRHMHDTRTSSNSEGINEGASPSLQVNDASEESFSDGVVLQDRFSKGTSKHKDVSIRSEENQEKHLRDNCNTPIAKRKKWECGRLVVVED